MAPDRRFLVKAIMFRPVILCLLLVAPVVAWAQASAPPDAAAIRDAASALAAGNTTHAETELESVLRASPTNVHALTLLGIIRAEQRREPDAEQLFRKAIALRPDFAGAHASLGLLYLQMGKDDLAIPSLKEALRLDPGRKDAQGALTEILRTQAHAAAEHGELEKALALLIEARRVNPSSADVQYDLGMVALRMALFPDAIDAFTQTLKLRPDDSQALYGLGRAQMALARFDNAQQAFAGYVELRPKDASGHYALGVTLQALQRSTEAQAEYEKSIELQPRQTESYFRLGLMALETGDLDAASQEFERVLGRAPQHGGALTGMGRVRFQQKNYSDAVDFLAKAVASDPGLREAHYYLGLADARLGRKADSEKELEKASQIEHEEVEKHQNVLRILDPDQVSVPEPKQKQ